MDSWRAWVLVLCHGSFATGYDGPLTNDNNKDDLTNEKQLLF
jgi:hypothetical protein